MNNVSKILSLLLLSANIHAQPCTEVAGDVTLKLSQIDNDALVEYSMKFADPYYPKADLFMIKFKSCFDDNCKKSQLTFINPPQGFNDEVKYRIKNDSRSSKSYHTFFYEILIPRYGCDVKKEIIIKI